LNVFCEVPGTGDRLVGMLYSLEGLLRSDILPEFPLDGRGCLSAARAILPAMMALQVFRPGHADPGNRVGIDSSGRLVVEFRAHAVDDAEKRILGALRRIGYLGHSRFIRRPIPGGSIHYAGTLPMRANPSRPYETDRSGRLHGSRRVHIGDSASFPALPAKNLTLTIMSNAARVATLALAGLEAE
jgi:choline dehydrogenase-like flavoprotein